MIESESQPQSEEDEILDEEIQDEELEAEEPSEEESLNEEVAEAEEPLKEEAAEAEEPLKEEAAEAEEPLNEEVVETEEISEGDTVSEAIEDENPEQTAVPKKFEANRTSVEEIREADGMERVISLLKRSRAAEVKEMVRDEYPEINLDGEAVMNLTKKELLDWLKDFYTD